jgi:hypothetical protein
MYAGKEGFYVRCSGQVFLRSHVSKLEEGLWDPIVKHDAVRALASVTASFTSTTSLMTLSRTSRPELGGEGNVNSKYDQDNQLNH